MLQPLARELSRTQSTSTLSQPHHPALSLRLSVVYEKLMDAHFIMSGPGPALLIYSSAVRAGVPCSAFVYKRAIQSLFRRLLPIPDSDMRRFSQPRRADAGTGFHTPHSSTSPPVAALLSQLKAILDRTAAENIPLSSRMLADIFRGLGAILKLETQGTEPEERETELRDYPENNLQSERSKSFMKKAYPRFRLDRLVLHQETWTSIGDMIANILAQTTSATNPQQHESDGQLFLLMAWADVMLSLREDIADAVVRSTMSRSTLKALSRRVDVLIGGDQAWGYQKVFDRLVKSSYLRPHDVNSHGSIGSEMDPALDLPAGPAPGHWPVSRTLAEAQRISLLVRDRLVEDDSLAALLQFHSLASLCGAFRRLCDVHDPEDAPSLMIQTPRGGGYQRPPETVLAEARHELDVRVESVYVRLAGHALRTGDSGYVNDVLELAYTLPPRRNKLTFSRVWKRAMGAFVSWRSEWHGSAGIGRAFKTLAHLLGIGPDAATSRAPVTNAIDRQRPRAIAKTEPNRSLFDLSWLREQHRWPALGRNVFPRACIVSALINRAEESTPPYLRPGAKPDPTMGPKHLRDARRATEEADTRRMIRWLRENHPHYMPRPGDPTPSLAELDAQARAEAQSFRAHDWDDGPVQTNGLERSERAGRTNNYSAGVPATTILANVLGALSVPVSISEARRLGYSGPTYVKRLDKGSTLPSVAKE
ncbi:hypothetical protein RhiJN_16847 [Ceratobasidium sp. AG-Ba]|nr:hypothetical protein RhiJN_16847 [Ceratobasidium sp. AG-Ba]